MKKSGKTNTKQESSKNEPIDESTSKSGLKRRPGALVNYSMIVASMIVVLAGVRAARGVLGIFFLAAFFTVLLITPVNWLRDRKIPSWLALTIVVTGVAVIGLCSVTIIGTQLAQFSDSIPEYRAKFNERLKSYNLNVEDFFPSFLRSDDGETSEDEEQTSEPSESAEAPASDSKNPYFEEMLDLAKSNQALLEKMTQLFETIPSAGGGSTADREPGSSIQAVETTEGTDVSEPQEPRAFASNEPRDLTSSLNDETERDGLVPDNPQSHLFKTLDAENGEVATDVAKGRDDDKENDGASSDVKEPSVKRTTTLSDVSAVDASSQQLFKFLRGLAGELSALLSNAFLITLLLIFMLIETPKIPIKLGLDVPQSNKNRGRNVVDKKRGRNAANKKNGQDGSDKKDVQDVVDKIRNYMIIKTMMSVVVGVLATVICSVARVQYPLLWGFVAFFLNYIPNIGSIVAAVPPVILATVGDGGVGAGIAVAVGFLLINCVVGYVIEPRLLGDGLGLSPLIVLVALIFFGWLLGPVGMFLSPPLAVIMKIIFRSFPETVRIADLMSNRLPKKQRQTEPSLSPAGEEEAVQPLPPIDLDEEAPSATV